MLLMAFPYQYLHQQIFIQTFFIVVSLVFAILLYFMPDTPQSLIKRNEIVVSEKE